VVDDVDLRQELRTRGRERLREFTEMDASVSMLEAICEVV
jgi:hypothetical protein